MQLLASPSRCGRVRLQKFSMDFNDSQLFDYDDYMPIFPLMWDIDHYIMVAQHLTPALNQAGLRRNALAVRCCN